jgi:hypothetical protein
MVSYALLSNALHLSKGVHNCPASIPCDAITTLPLVPPFLTQNFTLTLAGFLADSITSNNVILLAERLLY